ncbi:hypothetical protein IB276_33290 [Ensifer sp. ENS04]|uniref:hypothetical protein n=1 Tax=Ensifer sp. ENS04 TaxID=2769281 RepID=UPI00177E5BE2|nr:hypothetical protein [Ensifer sp. ENS04]MBD9544323.1 hypothetical protein [Ensifer sp. ENS04]
MSLTARAFKHNSSAFVAELQTAAAARRMHGDHSGAFTIDRSIIALQAGQEIEDEWTLAIAKRFLNVS